ncbi:hypothetical protein [Rhizobacter sp. P5_C2]
MSLPSPSKVLHSATKVLNRLNKAPEYFSNGQKVSGRAWHEAQGLIYHKNNADEIAGEVAEKTLQIVDAVARKVNKARDEARGALDDCVGSAKKVCHELGRHAKRAIGGAVLQVSESGIPKKVAHHAKGAMSEVACQARGAVSVVAQGAEDAASNMRKSARNAASRVRGVARKLNSTGRDALSQLAAKIKSRKYEPRNYQYAEPARADSEKGHYQSHCVETLDVVAQQCRVDGDTGNAYKAFYDHAAYVAQQTRPQQTQQTHLISYAELLLIAQLVQSNMPRLHSHHLNNETAAFTTLVFDMRTQALSLRTQENQEARG